MSLTLVASKNPAIEGESITLTASGDGAYMNFAFSKDGQALTSSPRSTYTIEKATSDSAGVYSVLATVSGGDTETAEVTITVTEIPVPEDGYAYVHPLPQREAGFIQIGWWVINEIQRAKELGLDWRTAPDPLNYKRDLLTLAKMFSEYENPEVQESRNGYVWGPDKVEAGYGFPEVQR